jgi:nitrite reductase/ring-hydroxylating ferredoxin subunit
MSQFTKVATTGQLPPGKALCVEHAGESVALFNVGGKIYALGDTCTHVGGPLSEGEVEGTTVTCPWHGATFDLATGAVTGPPAGAAVPCYRVQIEAGEIRIASA